MMDRLDGFTTRVRFWFLGWMMMFAVGTVARAQEMGALPSAPLPSAFVSKPVLLKSGVLQLPYAAEQATGGPLALSLDDAIARGEQRNLQVRLASQNELTVHGTILSVGNALLPNMEIVAKTATQQINLAAMGFKPQSLAGLIPAGSSFPTIVKVDTTSLEFKLDQALFNVPAYFLFRAAQKAEKGAELTTLNARGGVVQAVATTYLRALADAAEIENARALEKADREVLRQATERHDAGVGTNLDVLRARVQLQTQQQVEINAENTFAKEKIALTRLIGLPAEQELVLTDPVPYEEYATLPLEEAKNLAFARRKDYLNLLAQVEIAVQARRAVRAERYPVLAFNGYYGVVGETRGLYHGSFVAQGTLQVPVFQEASLRGQREVADAQLTALRQQEASLKITVEQQIRASMLDVQSAGELVKVARSNVGLAGQVLEDATSRFTAGVDDNLPVVQAQATLAGAQTRLVETLFQYNQAKLALARNTGVVETQYKAYLGR